MSNTKYFADLIKVCSVLPVFAVMPAMAEVPDGYTETTEQSIKLPTNIVGGVYEKNYVRSAENTPVSDQNLTYLYFSHGLKTTTIDSSLFKNNDTEVGGGLAVAGGGSPYWPERLGGNQTQLSVKNSKFIGNRALYDAGAIGNYGFLTIGEGVVFENNISVNGIETVDYMGGGALGLGSLSTTVIDDDTRFIRNYSGTYGGAIATRRSENGNNSIAKLDVQGYFEENGAKYRGGAIYNTFYNGLKDGTGVTVDADFVRNHADELGGAIYNDGTIDKSTAGSGAVMTIRDSDFKYNTAGISGGAIYNTGALTVVESDFSYNTADKTGGAIYSSGTLNLYDVEFISNSALGVDGGALLITGGNENSIYNSKFVSNHADSDSGGAILLQNGVLNIDNTYFEGNTAKQSGAIFTYSTQENTLNITKSVFDNNKALGVGAVQAMYRANISDTVFKNNVATTDTDGAGALFIGAVGKAMLNHVTFENNEADYRGGAISTRSADLGNNKDAKLDVLNSTFIGNKAGTTGGAFDNYLYSSVTDDIAVYFENVMFDTNKAALGGAVYNHGAEDRAGNTASTHINGATFIGNIATYAGGAIYNEENGALMLSGNNTFTGNTAKGAANDIYNDGTLTIASGTTSIDGGIDGAGALDIQSDATLNMNYASITQGTINIDGTLMASLRDANDTVDIAGTLSGTGNVLLSAGGVGTYDVSLFTDANLNVDFGKTYQTTIEDGMAILGVKDVATIAADTGITGGAAGAVSALAVSSDANLQKVSLAIQEALNNGDTALVEKEMAKVNPDTKPVGQSVAASVQGQVVSVAAGRMSTVGGATGRAGGDVTGAGVWAQGLVNKSKMGGTFEGRTTGFALGGDTLIDDVFTLGGGFAFSNTDVEADGRDTNVESNSVFAYAQYKPSAWYANATVSYTMSDYEEDAQIIGGVMLNNNYDTKAFGVQTMFGYDFASGVTPEAGVRYLYVSQDEHRNGIGNIVSEMDYGFWTGVAGLKYAFAIESDTDVKFSPSLRAAMTYDFTTPDTVAKIVVPGASAYYVDIESLSRMGGEFGIGLTAEYRGLELSLNYELDLHKDYTSQTGLLKFRYNF